MPTYNLRPITNEEWSDILAARLMRRICEPDEPVAAIPGFVRGADGRLQADFSSFRSDVEA